MQPPADERGALAVITSVQESCDRNLWRLLTYQGPAIYVGGDLADHPRDTLQRVVDALEPLGTPVGPEGVISALAPLVLVFGTTEAAKSPTFWTIYVDALADLPGYALDAGIRAYVRQADANWFPRPGPLRDLAEKAVPKAVLGLHRARMAIRWIDEREQNRTHRRSLVEGPEPV